jgi:glutamate dehydrogenase (NADP+)
MDDNGVFPCATQNANDAKALIKNKCIVIGEGANMPYTKEATDLFIKSNCLFAPAKATNARGVAVNEFEMSQNGSMQSWTAKVVDNKLKKTMYHICDTVSSTAKEYNIDGNYVAGANIAGFKRAADAMIAEGI